MFSKVIFWIGVVIFVILLGLAIFYPDIKVTMTEDQVNEQVSKFMPYSKDIDMEFKGVNHQLMLQADNAKITFMEDGRISIYSGFKLDKVKTSAKGHTEIISGIYYEISEGAFYAYESELKDFKIEEMNIGEDDKSLASEQVKDVKEKTNNKISKLKGFLKNNLSEEAFNKVETASNDAKDKVISHVKDNKDLYLTMVKEVAKKGMVKVFENVPLYTLDNGDIKQKISSMALKDVVVEKGTITVVFSIAKFLSSLMLYCLSGIIFVLLFVAGLKDPKVFEMLLKAS